MKIQLSRTRLAQHIAELASAFQIELCADPNLPLLKNRHECLVNEKHRGQVVARRIFVRPITCESTYAIALHELGHGASPTGMLKDVIPGNASNLHIDEETAAWDWAMHYALVWTRKMEAVKQFGLTSHILSETCRREKRQVTEQEEANLRNIWAIVDLGPFDEVVRRNPLQELQELIDLMLSRVGQQKRTAAPSTSKNPTGQTLDDFLKRRK